MKPKEQGETHKTFLCDYRFHGETYCIHIVATSFEEAEQHIRCISENGKIVGELVLGAKIPFT